MRIYFSFQLFKWSSVTWNMVGRIKMTQEYVVLNKGRRGLTWSWLTCSWSACCAFAAIWDAWRSFVEHRCFSPSISSAQYLCLSSNSWQVSVSFSSKLTCCKVKGLITKECSFSSWLRAHAGFYFLLTSTFCSRDSSVPAAPVVHFLSPAAFVPSVQSVTHL